MLRIGFLPSDFNPMVLMLGEADDLRLLAGVLRRFSHDRANVQLDRLGFCTAGLTPITLTGSPGAAGIQPTDNGFVWRVDPAQAGHFAEQVDALAAPALMAGSELLTCTNAEEIPVKVSRGEYTDDFLLGRAA
jgi:hypothetical protein